MQLTIEEQTLERVREHVRNAVFTIDQGRTYPQLRTLTDAGEVARAGFETLHQAAHVLGNVTRTASDNAGEIVLTFREQDQRLAERARG